MDYLEVNNLGVEDWTINFQALEAPPFSPKGLDCFFMEQRVNREGAGEWKDVINKLPESILLYILSFLPIKDVLRTSVLSTRWKHLWTPVSDIVFDENVHNLGLGIGELASLIQWKDCCSFMNTEVPSCVEYDYQ